MAEETIYLCNFRVSVDGDWLCLKELSDMQLEVEEGAILSPDTDDGKGVMGDVSWGKRGRVVNFPSS